MVPDLEELGTVEVEKDRTIISVVGEGLRNTPGIAAKVFSVISDINVSMISVGASSVNLTFMVDAEHAAEAITRLHRVCFEQSTDPAGKAAVPTGHLSDVRATAPISPTVRRSSRG